MLKKIVVIGPESTGKSTLCEQLAEHFNTSWCPEFAREYLLKFGTNYQFEDLLKIAKGQLELEDTHTTSAINNNSNFLFIDTDMLVLKVWNEFVFENCHHFILEQIAERKYDLYLLCNTDLPWVSDELREYPDLKTRETLFTTYKDILINQNTPWVLISGDSQNRLKLAIDAINTLHNNQ